MGSEKGVPEMGSEKGVPEMWANIVFLGGAATVHTHPKSYYYSNECYFSEGNLLSLLNPIDILNIIPDQQPFGNNMLPGVRYLGAPNGVMYKNTDFNSPNTIVCTDLPVASTKNNGKKDEIYPNGGK